MPRRRLDWIGPLLILAVLAGGCRGAAPSLIPSGPATPDNLESDHPGGLEISVRPIHTSGFRSEDREEVGIDLSAYYTTFYVEVYNRLNQPVEVDPAGFFLVFDGERPLQSLSDSEAIRYYQIRNEMRSPFRLFPRSPKTEQRELLKIQSLQLRHAIVPPNGRYFGMVYFRKRLLDCNQAVLTIRGVQVKGAEPPRPIRFRFRCNAV